MRTRLVVLGLSVSRAARQAFLLHDRTKEGRMTWRRVRRVCWALLPSPRICPTDPRVCPPAPGRGQFAPAPVPPVWKQPGGLIRCSWCRTRQCRHARSGRTGARTRIADEPSQHLLSADFGIPRPRWSPPLPSPSLARANLSSACHKTM